MIDVRFELPIVVEEVSKPSQLEEIKKLSRYHYIGQENLWGRKQYLIASIVLNGYKEIVGYILLNSAPLLSRVRNGILGNDSIEKRKNSINYVVRIARVVVHPERRGLGIGTSLVRCSIEYAKKYWNVLGTQPYLLETVAEMSKFHPVFRKAGMFNFGITEGDEKIIFTDKENLPSGQGKGHFKASLYRNKLSTKKPKPYYAIGLDEDIQKRISQYLKNIEPIITPNYSVVHQFLHS